MNRFDEMRQAIQDARAIQDAADGNARDLASLLVGRLRILSSGRHGTSSYEGHNLLCKLKKELAEYNMRTGEWKS